MEAWLAARDVWRDESKQIAEHYLTQKKFQADQMAALIGRSRPLRTALNEAASAKLGRRPPSLSQRAR